MPKSPSSDLYDLVHSLTQAEKKQFRSFVSTYQRSGGKLYLKMLDLLVKQKKFDESKVRGKMKELSDARFANVKKYLHDLLMESLRVTHAFDDEEIRLKNVLLEVEILYKRRLMKSCLKLIRTSKTKAKRMERHVLLYELSNWEERVLNETLNIPRTPGAVDELLLEETNALETQLNISRYRMLMHSIHKLFVAKGMLSKENDIRSLDSIIAPVKEGRMKSPQVYQELYFHHNLMGMYHMMKSEWKETFIERKKLLDVIEAHTEQIDLAPHLYASALANLIVTCEYAKESNELQKCFRKVEQMLANEKWKSNHTVQVRLFGACSSMLHYYIHSGEFESGKKLIERIAAPFREFGGEIPASTQASYRYSFAYALFGAGEYREALKWINLILNERSDVRQDITGMAHLLNLVVHFELGSESSMEYYVRSAYRYILKKKNISGMESAILRFLRKNLPGINSDTELKQALLPLREQLESLLKDPAEKRILDYFNFIAWIDSRLTGRSFAECIRIDSEIY